MADGRCPPRPHSGWSLTPCVHSTTVLSSGLFISGLLGPPGFQIRDPGSELRRVTCQHPAWTLAGGWGAQGCRAGRHLPERAIQVGTVDEAELGVGPVELLLLQVDGQPVGPVDVGVHDDFAGTAVHACSLDSRCLAPVRPVHVPNEGAEHEQGRLARGCFVSVFCLHECKRVRQRPRNRPRISPTRGNPCLGAGLVSLPICLLSS